MSDPVRFLGAFGRALSAAALYRSGHPALERAIDGAWTELNDLVAAEPKASFTLLDGTILYADAPLRERRTFEWAARLSAAGLQRIEFDGTVTREDLDGFLAELSGRLSGASETSSVRQGVRRGIRAGALGLRSRAESESAEVLAASLREEADTIRWLHQEASEHRMVALLEAEAVVRSLGVAMHREQRIVVPLLQLKAFDQYTTTHALNVAVLSMAVAEYMQLSPREVRGYGVAGLLHDIGKTCIPTDILTKPGRLTDTERQEMNRHPVEGARLLLRSHGTLDLAATVAYEHHIMIDGSGYPHLHFRRDCHQASRLVHVCDVFDALRTIRPYRDAWPLDKTIAYIRQRAGTEFDATIVAAFTAMIESWHPRFAVLASEDDAIRAEAGAA